MSRLIDADALIQSEFKNDISYKAFVNLVKRQPTIEERKMGQWEEIRVMPEAYDITGEKTWASVMRCNKCGFEAFAIEGHFAQYHFCPNCGADMRGEQDG